MKNEKKTRFYIEYNNNIQLNIGKFKKDIFLDKTKKQLNEINRKLNEIK